MAVHNPSKWELWDREKGGAKPGEYEDAYELSLERSWLIYINTDLSLLLY